MTEWEKQKAYEDLSRLIRVSEQKKQNNKISIEKRIKEIKRKFLGGNN